MSTTPSNPTPEPRRFFSRQPRPPCICMATFGLIVIAAGLRVGIPIYRQHAAIRAIQRLGGNYYLESQPPGLLERYVGDEWASKFVKVEHVGLNETQVTDPGLEYLDWLPSLKSLDLCRSNVSDQGLAHVRTQTNLNYLNLCLTPISDAALAHLQKLTNLEHLYLSDTGVTNDGVHLLQQLSSLQAISLDGTEVNGSGLIHLAGLPSIMSLFLGGAHLCDADLEPIKRFSGLKELWLDAPQVSHEALSELKTVLPGLVIHTDLAHYR